jgi:hypothetical protein
MSTVIVTATAIGDLDTLIRTHSLPASTRQRVGLSLAALAEFPLLGSRLNGRWSGYRFILGRGAA